MVHNNYDTVPIKYSTINESLGLSQNTSHAQPRFTSSGPGTDDHIDFLQSSLSLDLRQQVLTLLQDCKVESATDLQCSTVQCLQIVQLILSPR